MGYFSWDYEMMEEKVRELVPDYRKNKITGVPIPVTEFQGIKCSLYADPLEKDPNGVEFEYREMKFPRYNALKHKKLRKNGRIVVLYPGEPIRKGRFLLAYEDPKGYRSPIVEVNNAGRACSRARKWAMLLECDFQEKIDGKVVIPLEEYRELLIKLGDIRVI